MKRILMIATAVAAFGVIPLVTQASPEDDLKAFRAYFLERFPNVPLEEFANGVYAIDSASREQWEAIEEFPPYEIAIEEGEELFNTPFKNGKTFASCFRNGGIGIQGDYPYFDKDTGRVQTLATAVNDCLVKNGEKPLGYGKGKLASILAYMAYTSRGQVIDIKVPHDQRAMDAYDKGKQFYYARRGQLNMSCAHCHVDNAGNKIRADILSPALGHVSHFPVYRSKWGGLGTLHRRFSGCNKQVRAKDFPLQSDEYRNLEYFMTYMSNGIQWNGPGARK
ncbi:MAG: sulfur oxidation c-type cytochrome SoxA [Gammaproteobacteria bacterium SG8_11]|nr:MAG: sulfur oxidation c-type cytochrome SoxA [Gammaproteobacteria bacterium SG8_11]